MKKLLFTFLVVTALFFPTNSIFAAWAVPSSSQTNIGNANGSVVITKPTGLAVGDLMIAIVGTEAGADAPINTASGWDFFAQQSFSSVDPYLSVQWKIATAGDVAASNFTFTSSNATARLGGAIMRVTGHHATPEDVSNSTFTDGANSATINFTGRTFNPTYNNTLLILFTGGRLGGGNAGSMSGYTISGTNPTWTEVYDGTIDSGTADPVQGAAWAVLDTTRTITSYGSSISASKTNHGGIIFAFRPAADNTAVKTVNDLAKASVKTVNGLDIASVKTIDGL